MVMLSPGIEVEKLIYVLAWVRFDIDLDYTCPRKGICPILEFAFNIYLALLFRK